MGPAGEAEGEGEAAAAKDGQEEAPSPPRGCAAAAAAGGGMGAGRGPASSSGSATVTSPSRGLAARPAPRSALCGCASPLLLPSRTRGRCRESASKRRTAPHRTRAPARPPPCMHAHALRLREGEAPSSSRRATPTARLDSPIAGAALPTPRAAAPPCSQSEAGFASKSPPSLPAPTQLRSQLSPRPPNRLSTANGRNGLYTNANHCVAAQIFFIPPFEPTTEGNSRALPSLAANHAANPAPHNQS